MLVLVVEAPAPMRIEHAAGELTIRIDVGLYVDPTVGVTNVLVVLPTPPVLVEHVRIAVALQVAHIVEV